MQQHKREPIRQTQRDIVKEFADHLIKSDPVYRHKFLVNMSAKHPERVCSLISYLDDEMRSRFFTRLMQHRPQHYDKIFTMYQERFSNA